MSRSAVLPAAAWLIGATLVAALAIGALMRAAPDDEDFDVYEYGKYYVVVLKSVDADLCERIMKTYAGQSERRSHVSSFGVEATGTTEPDGTNFKNVTSVGQEGFDLTQVENECGKIDEFTDEVGRLLILRPLPFPKIGI